jgi:hypothetical protein
MKYRERLYTGARGDVIKEASALIPCPSAPSTSTQHQHLLPEKSKARNHFGFLQKLFSLCKQRRAKKEKLKRLKRLLKSASKDEILSVSECALNYLNNKSYSIPICQIKKIKPYKNLLRSLSNRSVPVEVKRKHLLTSLTRAGGAFPLLSLLTPLLTAAVSSVIG